MTGVSLGSKTRPGLPVVLACTHRRRAGNIARDAQHALSRAGNRQLRQFAVEERTQLDRRESAFQVECVNVARLGQRRFLHDCAGAGKGINRRPDDFTDAVLAAFPEPGIGDADSPRKANPSPRAGSSAAKLKAASAMPGARMPATSHGESDAPSRPRDCAGRPNARSGRCRRRRIPPYASCPSPSPSGGADWPRPGLRLQISAADAWASPHRSESPQRRRDP